MRMVSLLCLGPLKVSSYFRHRGFFLATVASVFLIRDTFLLKFYIRISVKLLCKPIHC